MAIDLATLPQFLTRDDAADLLRLTTKSIDTMVGDGKLAKVKLGARRTGITRESILDHLKRSGLAMPGKPVADADQSKFKMPDYVSPLDVLIVQIDVELGPIDLEFLTMLCLSLDNWLPQQGIKGCVLFASLERRSIAVQWHKSLGYPMKKVMRACAAMDRKIGAIDPVLHAAE
jgi:hypothetical protein